MAQNVRTAMSGDPVTVDEGAALIDGARLMAEHAIGDVLVCDGGSLVGILTDRDVPYAASRVGPTRSTPPSARSAPAT